MASWATSRRIRKDPAPCDGTTTAASTSHGLSVDGRDPRSEWPTDGAATPETVSGVAAGRGEDPSFAAPARFVKRGLLGRGGMGAVYLADDQQLQRRVAIKVFAVGDRRRAEAMLREAQAQAVLTHDRICKVYDVGQTSGVGYIAMEYIQGETLARVAQRVSPETLVALWRQVAAAAHHAHEHGLIHRDIKPGNIMVKDTPEGPAAYLLDFGLAHRWSAGEAAWAHAGTPAFMAPEQAEGRVGCLDPRTDVYGLGATLAWCLTRRLGLKDTERPEPGVSPAERPSLQALRKHLPRDLWCILSKCLEVQRADRYGSAGALVADIDRFYAHLPVAARGRGPLYLAGLFVRRRRALSALLVLLVAAGLGLLGNTLHLRRQAALKTAFVGRMLAHGSDVEAQTRFIALSPAHPLADSRARLERLPDMIREEALAARQADPAAVDDALGRVYLALGRHDLALTHLQRAWDAGYADPGCAFALARTLGAHYQQALLETAAEADPERRGAMIRAAETRYRDVVSALLAQSRGDTTHFPWFIDAQIAFYEGRYNDALALLGAHADHPRWFFEVDLLTGDIYRARMLTAPHASEARAADYANAVQAYAAAQAVAQSDVRPLVAAARLHKAMMRRALFEQASEAPYFTRAMAELDKAAYLDPDHVPILICRANLLKSAAEAALNRGEDGETLLARAVDDAARAVALLPGGADAWTVLVEIHLARAYAAMRGSEDPTARLDAALDAMSHVAAGDRDAAWYFGKGLAHKLQADRARSLGADSAEPRARAVAAYRRAVALDPHMSGAYLNLAVELFLRVEAMEGEARRPGLTEAVQAFQDAARRNPGHYLPPFYLGRCFADLARLDWWAGRDPEPAFSQALTYYEAAAAINDRIPNFYLGMAVVWLDRARYLDYLGLPQDDTAVMVGRMCDATLRCNPGDASAYLVRGNMAMWQALDAKRRGGNPETFMAEADRLAARASALQPKLVQARVFSAHLTALRGIWAQQAGRPPEAHVRRARGLLAQVGHTTAYGAYVAGLCWSVEAATGPMSAHAAQEGRCAFEEAVALGGVNMDYRLGLVRHLILSAETAGSEASKEFRAAGASLLAAWPDAAVASPEVGRLRALLAGRGP